MDNPEELHVSNSSLTVRSYSFAAVIPQLNGSTNEGAFEKDGTPIDGSSLRRAKRIYRGPKEEFNAAPTRREASAVLFGGYYFNHFGHFITEGLSRLWKYGELSDIDKIVFLKGDLDRLGRSDVLKHLIPEADLCKIEIITEATQYDEVIIPDPGFVIRSSFNANHWSWLKRATDMVEARGRIQKRPEPLYLSRSSQDVTKRLGYGELELEAALMNAGFRVITPEKLPFLQQVRILAEHDTIVGLEGSHLHNLIFSRGEKRVIQLDYRPVNGNFLLIDRMLSNDASYINIVQPRRYEGFITSDGVTEPFIFDPSVAADHIAELISWKVNPVPLSSDTRRAFAMNWLVWWDRNARAKAGTERGRSFTASRFQNNSYIALAAI
ncbi:glycosyltransferase 61 family protein [Paracoccus sp. CPCC 101403]|uniref:Glycosyltransferase 61 family protein n=1 Tax=Paracoccus broussonetiae TaxID=3075834 RepID=A0ABU3EK71_9RHOB|nr:glycosyltransferase 61 family protein [Paracoccus sp. CPCC 101403]MDT1064629.1 glycosyltransferase 61 family protein [Paracoccus sp. CPCC 101403]